ncbi:Protein of unknown function [Pyronema omphalodes CBS 100304]|uniref:Uncharacterized protein n=1 Tax=Pyronema omphalodes (strain CBS 100304) TaxID=1076935 RepID=U4LQG0_PYROM|nr:Protein of unknown function [Pyronema omphalodes CBS 100304]
MSSFPDSSNTRANSSRITQTPLAVPVVLIQAVEAYTSAHKIINESGRSLRHQKKDLLKLRISHGNFLKQLATILLGGNIPQE